MILRYVTYSFCFAFTNWVSPEIVDNVSCSSSFHTRLPSIGITQELYANEDLDNERTDKWQRLDLCSEHRKGNLKRLLTRTRTIGLMQPTSPC